MFEQVLGEIHTFLVHNPIIAPSAFIGLHVLMAVLFVPCSPMTLMAGVLWGSLYGLCVSLFAALLSSGTTFLLSRKFLHRRIESLLKHKYPQAYALLSKSANFDWQVMALAQINPLIPASTLGYAFGLSSIPFSRYLLLSGLFMFPLQVLYVLLGDSLTSLTAIGQWKWALLLIFVCAIFILGGRQIFLRIYKFFHINKDEP